MLKAPWISPPTGFRTRSAAAGAGCTSAHPVLFGKVSLRDATEKDWVMCLVASVSRRTQSQRLRAMKTPVTPPRPSKQNTSEDGSGTSAVVPYPVGEKLLASVL